MSEDPTQPTPETSPLAPAGAQSGETTPTMSAAADGEAMAETAADIEDLDTDAPRVGIVMGSKSDLPAMEKAEAELTERGISLRDPRDVGSPRSRHGRRLRQERADARPARDHRRRRPRRRRCPASSPPTPICR